MLPTNGQGYAVERFTKNVPHALICSICTDVFFNPTTSLCGHTFCRACIERWLASHTTCPVCQASLKNNQLARSVVVQQMIDPLQLRCANFAHGCTVVARVEEIADHEVKCSFGAPASMHTRVARLEQRLESALQTIVAQQSMLEAASKLPETVAQLCSRVAVLEATNAQLATTIAEQQMHQLQQDSSSSNESDADVAPCSLPVSRHGELYLRDKSTLNWRKVESQDFGNRKTFNPTGLARTAALVRSVDLRDCALTPEDLDIIAKHLNFTTRVTYLNLSYNNLGPQGSVHLVEPLQRMISLHTLSLCDTNLGPEGATQVLSCLHQLLSLRVLHLSHNHLGSQGGQMLSTALQSISNLEVVMLDGNNLGDRCVPSLLKSLEKQRRLETVWLSNNEFSEQAKQQVRRTLQHVPTLSV